MKSETLLRIAIGFYIFLFFAYLFGPLILMSMTAFNSSPFPRVSPWECFSVEWFDVLRRDATLMEGFRHSLLIGIGVVLVSVPLGLAGALMLTQVSQRVRPLYYTIVVSPILVPGVVLGISTLIFWDRIGTIFDAGYDSIFYDGTFLTVLGQSTFISAYSMLIFISRLQRFDPALEEAALDLGATQVQAFRKILLPFLKPAVASAAVLAFLASFENYNTTVFTILSESTLTTVLASKVRYGINPSISALAVVIVVLTLIGAVTYELLRRREATMQKAVALEAAGQASASRTARARAAGTPAVVLILLIFIAGFGTVWFSGSHGVGECKAQVAEQKHLAAERRVQQRKSRQMFESAQPGTSSAPADGSRATERVRPKGTEGFQNIFDPENLKGQAGTREPQQEEPEETEAPGTEGYRNIFDPGNLKGQVGVDGKPKE